jgi:hypothetical protein
VIETALTQRTGHPGHCELPQRAWQSDTVVSLRGMECRGNLLRSPRFARDDRRRTTCSGCLPELHHKQNSQGCVRAVIWLPGQVPQSAIRRDNHLLPITKAERVRAVILPSAGAGRPHWREQPCDLKSRLPRSGSSLTARCIPGTSSGARSS